MRYVPTKTLMATFAIAFGLGLTACEKSMDKTPVEAEANLKAVFDFIGGAILSGRTNGCAVNIHPKRFLSAHFEGGDR